jgi:hypothetical protein
MLARADEVIELTTKIAAVHESATGPSRHGVMSVAEITVLL